MALAKYFEDNLEICLERLERKRDWKFPKLKVDSPVTNRNDNPATCDVRYEVDTLRH